MIEINSARTAAAPTVFPALATDGTAVRGAQAKPAARMFGDIGAIFVIGTLASTAASVTIRLFGYSTDIADLTSPASGWIPIGTGTGSSSGVLNGGAVISEIDTTSHLISFTQMISGLSLFERLYAQITTIAGTSLSVRVFVDSPSSMQNRVG